MDDAIVMCMRYETFKGFGTARRKALPTVLITGYLGSGKTTLLRHLLRAKGVRVGAVVGDAAGLFDANAARADSASVVGVSGAAGGGGGAADKPMMCFCCTASGELEDSVYSVLRGADGGEGDNDPRAAAGFGSIDYLAIETSGVTEPHALIAALSKRFGRLARIRVDAVVAVVDADVLAQLLNEAGGDVDAARARLQPALAAQLRAADVVLLNKRDLLTEHGPVAAVEAGVLALARGATEDGAALHLVCLRRRAPPLESILDVHAVETTARVQSHETVEPVYELGSGTLRSSPARPLSAAALASSRSGGSHLARDAFGAVEWTHSGALRLDRWQALLATSGASAGGVTTQKHHSPRAAASPWRLVVRAKGSVVYALGASGGSSRSACTWSFQSCGLGGRRFSNEELAAPRLEGARCTLVAIGPGLQGSAGTLLRRLLRWCTVDAAPRGGGEGAAARGVAAAAAPPADVAESHAELLAALRKETIFEVDDVGAETCAAPLVRFRLNPAPLFGVTTAELTDRYGVDIDSANVALADAVNAARGPLLVVTVTGRDGGGVWCVVALPPPLPLPLSLKVGEEEGEPRSAARAVGALFATELRERGRRVAKACTRTVPLCPCD